MVEAALFALDFFQLAAERSVRDTHPVPPYQEQDGRNASRQNGDRSQEDYKQHLHRRLSIPESKTGWGIPEVQGTVTGCAKLPPYSECCIAFVFADC